jgi:hypothetical protein
MIVRDCRDWLGPAQKPALREGAIGQVSLGKTSRDKTVARKSSAAKSTGAAGAPRNIPAWWLLR